MKVRACVYVQPNWCMSYIKSLEYSLKELGITDSIDIQIASANINWTEPWDVGFFIVGGKSLVLDKHKDKVKICLQIEQLIKCRVEGVYRMSTSFDYILEPFRKNAKLKATDHVFYCPIGYSPVWERPVKKVKKDIDVLFYGELHEITGRGNYLRYLKDNGINVLSCKNLYGDKLYNYISRSKIIIWLKHSVNVDYAQLHCLPAQAQKEFVMVENVLDYGLFEPDKNFVVFSNKDDCLKKIRFYLNNEKERNEFAEKAYQNLITKTYTDSISGAGISCSFLDRAIEQKK